MIKKLLTAFDSHEGGPFDPKPYLYLATMNITTLFLVGRNFKSDSEVFKVFTEFEQVSMAILNVASEGAILDLFPWLRYISKSLANSVIRIRPLRTKMCSLLKNEAAKSESEGFHDSLISALSKAVNDSEDLTPLQIDLPTVNIILGGTSTTTNFMYAFLNIMVHYPKVQERLHQEIDNVRGGREVSIVDRETMPYFQAAIFELLRYESLLPLGVPPATTKDTDVKGMKVPVGTTVFTKLFGLHHDERYFPDPFEFKPERYLDEEGNLVSADHPTRKWFLQFGAGPRVCFGESFAKIRMFLILVSVLQEYTIVADGGNELTPCDPRTFRIGVILQPQEYKICLINRQK